MSLETQKSIMERNKDVVRNFVEDVFNKHDLTAIDKYMYMSHSEGFKQYLGEFFQTHPDSHTTIEHIIAEDDKVFVMFNTKATNKQKRKTITIKSADLYTISNDMFVEHWDVVEATGFPNRKISEL
jgi:predicted SnoaL-like aldol condensation-catalyzing enzyme